MPGGTIVAGTDVPSGRRGRPRPSRPPGRTPCGRGHRRTASGARRSPGTGSDSEGTERRDGPRVRVVADPGRVIAAHGGVVDVAVDERRQRTLAPERRDEVDRGDRRRPAQYWAFAWRTSSSSDCLGQDVAAAGDTFPSGVPRGGRSRTSGWQRSPGNSARGMRQPDLDVRAGRGVHADRGRVRADPVQEVVGAHHVAHERRERRRGAPDR